MACSHASAASKRESSRRPRSGSGDLYFGVLPFDLHASQTGKCHITAELRVEGVQVYPSAASDVQLSHTMSTCGASLQAPCEESRSV